MKKILLMSGLIALTLSSSVSMAKTYGPAGCGLGTILINRPQGLFTHVFQSTSNSSFGTQTFGMTSGTSNCETIKADLSSQVTFIQANKIALSNDIARGNGETLASLAQLYGCGNSPELGSALKKNYGNIFTDNENSAEKINASIQNVIHSEKACI